MRNILADFYQILRNTHPIYTKILNIRSLIIDVNTYSKQWSENCISENQTFCYDILKSLYLEFVKIEKAIIQLGQLKTLNWDDKYDQEVYIPLSVAIDQLHILTFSGLSQFEELLMVHSTRFSSTLMEKQKFSIIIDQLLLSFEQVLLSCAPRPFKEDYYLVYQGFVKIIEHKILPQNDLHLFEGKLEALNFTWNNFHMKVLKGNTSISPRLKQFVSTIHNRWNSILKVILN